MKTKIITLAVLMITAVGFAQVKVSNALSPHNLSAAAYTTEICNVCHTPHNAAVADLPLWSHASSGAAFTVYSSNTMDGVVQDETETLGLIGGASKLCLGCHDGVTELDDFMGVTLPGTVMGAVSGNVGTSLTNDHPVSVTYIDGGTTQMIAQATVEATDANYLYPTLTVGVSTVECASCHSLHSGAAATKLLRTSNVGSALCLDCHDK